MAGSFSPARRESKVRMGREAPSQKFMQREFVDMTVVSCTSHTVRRPCCPKRYLQDQPDTREEVQERNSLKQASKTCVDQDNKTISILVYKLTLISFTTFDFRKSRTFSLGKRPALAQLHVLSALILSNEQRVTATYRVQLHLRNCHV